MSECFCLLLFIHFIKGCDVRDQTIAVSGYSGGSVLLPCVCKDSQSKPVTLTWRYYSKTQNQWIKVFKDEKYKNRWKLFNQSSPANLSLLISDLKKEDEGDYRCETSNQNYIDIRVTITGCDLDQNKQSLQVTGHSGESVVLPCSCSELQAKPQQLKWTFTPLNHRTEPEVIHPKEQRKPHTGRVKLLNEISPGNLSLLISNLKKEDQGEYQCSVYQQHVKITLSVQVHTTTEPFKQTEESTAEQSEDNSITSETSTRKQSDLSALHYILLSVFPVLLLLTVLALVYWKHRGRRNFQQVANYGPALVCGENEKMSDVNPDNLTQGQNLKQEENEDEVTYSSVVHVKNADKPHTQTVITEHSEYASIK